MKVLYKYLFMCLVASTGDGLSLIFLLQNTMVEMCHNGLSLSFTFKFQFKSKSILIKWNLISKMTNQLGQQMKNNIQVKVSINLVSDINLKCKL